jgi:hypothetical protein
MASFEIFSLFMVSIGLLLMAMTHILTPVKLKYYLHCSSHFSQIQFF